MVMPDFFQMQCLTKIMKPVAHIASQSNYYFLFLRMKLHVAEWRKHKEDPARYIEKTIKRTQTPGAIRRCWFLGVEQECVNETEVVY